MGYVRQCTIVQGAARLCCTVQYNMGYVRQLGQCRTVRGYEDDAGQHELCKTVQDSVDFERQCRTVPVMLDSAGQYGLCKTVQNSVGDSKQCSTVRAWRGIKTVKC